MKYTIPDWAIRLIKWSEEMELKKDDESLSGFIGNGYERNKIGNG